MDINSTIATLSATNSGLFGFSWLTLIQGFVQYLLSPAIMGGIVLFGLGKLLKLGEIKKDFEIIKVDVGDLKTKAIGMVTNITVIKTHLVDKAGMNASLFQTMSPLTLTPTGKTLIKQIGFDTYVKENYETISPQFTGADTLLKLDELSEVVVTDLFEAEKLPSYENEAFKRGISTEVLLRGCALYLRDFMAKKLSITE